MTREFELYNSTWDEIHTYLDSKYSKINDDSDSKAYRGRLPQDSRSDFSIVFRSIKLTLELSKTGKFKTVTYSVNLFPLYFSSTLALFFLAIISFWALDSWAYFSCGLPLIILFITQFRWIIGERLDEQLQADKERIIASRYEQGGRT